MGPTGRGLGAGAGGLASRGTAGGCGAGGGWAPRGAAGWPQPPPLPAQRLTGGGRGHSSHSSILPSPAASQLGGGSPAPGRRPLAGASPRRSVTGCWSRQVPNVTSAIKFVGRGDLGLGGWPAGGNVGSAGGPGRERACGRAVPALAPCPYSTRPSAASVPEQLARRGRRPWRGSGSGGNQWDHGGWVCAWPLGPLQPPQPRVAAAPLEAGWLVHVPGGLRCEDYVSFLSLASNGPLSLQLLQ